MQDYCRTWPDTLQVGHLRDKAIRPMIRLYIAPRRGDAAAGGHRTLIVPVLLAELLRLLLNSHDRQWVFRGIEGGRCARAY